MGLGVEVAKRVFSKNRFRSSAVDVPQSNNLCGDNFDSVPAEDNDVKSPRRSTGNLTLTSVAASRNQQGTEAVENDERIEEEKEAAIIIQSAFRGFQARQHQELQRLGGTGDFHGIEGPSKAFVCTSSVVQVGDCTDDQRALEATLVAQPRVQHRAQAQASRLKEESDGSTVSSQISNMRIKNRLEAMARRERALAYLRACPGKKKPTLRASDEPNKGWSWLERWMATRTSDAQPGSHRVGIYPSEMVEKFRVSPEKEESCGSNDVSVIKKDPLRAMEKEERRPHCPNA
ncbi:unnamed protein product [Spirodela intermedia]|uniref:Uncharacterized protein n=1 Tax=Spirodela intermedia TaxID=51605 RepID=A0A7I8LF72_SPIIN|nr:unnamed protein product [Spirodela intermedia]